MNLTILTGHGNMDRTIEALHCGVDDFIQKPFDAEKPILKMDRFFIKQEAFRKIKIYEIFYRFAYTAKKSATTAAHGLERENGCAWKNTFVKKVART